MKTFVARLNRLVVDCAMPPFVLAGILAVVPVDSEAEEQLLVAPSDRLIANWPARSKLEESGVTPFAILTAEVWGTAAGGVERRDWWNTLLDFGIELDTTRLGWWEGGNFMLQVHWVENLRENVDYGAFTGAFNPVSSVMAGNQFRLYNLYYLHTWGNDSVALKMGQIAMDDDFMGSDYAGLFLNSAFGAMPSQVGTPLATASGSGAAFPIYSVAAPGVFVRVRLTDSIATQLGLYWGRPGLDVPSNHGFDWASQSPPRLGVFWENSYVYKLAGHPATFRLGLSYHTGPVDVFSGTPTSEPPSTEQTVPNLYLIHDLELLADASGKTKLGLFARGGLTPHPDRSSVAAYADGGLDWFAPLPSRPDDLVGIGMSCTWFGSNFRESTGPDGVAANETTLELTYKAQITRWMSLQADAQWLFNPAVNPSTGSRETATVLGVRAEITF
jgi:porin